MLRVFTSTSPLNALMAQQDECSVHGVDRFDGAHDDCERKGVDILLRFFLRLGIVVARGFPAGDQAAIDHQYPLRYSISPRIWPEEVCFGFFNTRRDE